MKSLIRHDEETVRETDGIDGIDWQTGAPLTNEGWCGGPYAIAAEAPEDAIPSDFDLIPHKEIVGEDENGEPVYRRWIQAVLNRARYDARISE